MPVSDREEKALRFLGFAARAGRIIVGVPLLCGALQKGKGEKVPFVERDIIRDECRAIELKSLI